jgi:hypothetical protein
MSNGATSKGLQSAFAPWLGEASREAALDFPGVSHTLVSGAELGERCRQDGAMSPRPTVCSLQAPAWGPVTHVSKLRPPQPLKPGCPRLIRVDYHGSKEVPTGTCQSILKAAGLK